MISTAFPKRDPAGFFTIVAKFTVSELSVIPLIQQYVSLWVESHGAWVHIWRSDVITKEVWEYRLEFKSEPHFKIEPDSGCFSLVFEGLPTASKWKDFLVCLVNDLAVVFPETKFIGFES